jgi:hypothetical protein
MKYIKTYKLFESLSHELPRYRVGVRIYLTSVESNGDHFAGHWDIYNHNIKLEITSNVFSPDEAQVLSCLRSGQFTFDNREDEDNYDWCPQVKSVFSKDNIAKIASTCEDVGAFIDDIQGEIYDATVDYYSDLMSSDEEDNEDEEEEDEEDGMNLDALSEFTYGDNCQGVEYSSADPDVEISDDTISVVADEMGGDSSLDDAINRVIDEDWIDEKDVPVLLAHLSDPTRLDDWIKENPMDMDLISGLPEVKAGVLARTGLKDTSLVARSMRKGLI